MPDINDKEKYTDPEQDSLWRHKNYGYTKFKFIKVGFNKTKTKFWWEFLDIETTETRCFFPEDMTAIKTKKKGGKRGRPKKAKEEVVAINSNENKAAIEFNGKVLK